MVLRQFDPAARRLTVHTDLRAGKISDIARNPNVAVHVYDARAALQVRLSTRAQMHANDGVARASWAASTPASKAIYAISPAPGTEVAAPPPAPANQDAGFSNFAVLVLTFNALEWLWLQHGGHRRARFDWTADGALRATWLIP